MFNNDQGEELSHRFSRQLEGNSGTKGNEWIVETKGSENITVEYEVSKQKPVTTGGQIGNHVGYIGNGFALFSGDYILIYPSERRRVGENIKVSFSVPAGSQIVTPWEEAEGVYYPNKNTYEKESRFDALTNLINSSMMIGTYSLTEELVGGTLVKVVTPPDWGEQKQNEVATSTFMLVDYYNKLFGESIGDIYSVIYSPNTHDGNFIFGGEWTFDQSLSARKHGISYSFVAHNIFHRYNGFLWGWRDDRESLGALLAEGFDRYYETKSIITLAEEQKSFEGLTNMLEDQYNQYVRNYMNNNIIYVETRGNAADPNAVWMAYNQGALIALDLDMRIIEDTGGEKSLDDVLKVIHSRYRKYQGMITFDNLLDIIKEVTQQDYSQLLYNHVYTNKPLELDRYFQLESNGEKYYTNMIKNN